MSFPADTPAFVKRLYRAKAQSLPPVPVKAQSSLEECVDPQGKARERWSFAGSQIKAMLALRDGRTRRVWSGKGGRREWRLSVGRPVQPSTTLRASSYERFLGIPAPAGGATPVQRFAPRPARRVAGPTIYSLSNTWHTPSRSTPTLPPVVAKRTANLSQRKPGVSLCGTLWHEAADFPLQGRAAKYAARAG